MTLREVFARAGLETFTAAFEAQHVTLEDLAHLTDEDLANDFGMQRYMDRKRLRAALVGGPAPASLDSGATRLGSVPPVSGAETRVGLSGPADLPPRLGSYLVLGWVGAGSQGVVARARHADEAWARRQGDVALKFIHPHLVAVPAVRERFMAEAHVGRRLSHPSLAAVYDVISDGPWLAMAMEYVDGAPFSAHIQRGGMPLDAALALLEPLAEALDHLHAAGIVHRDVKPENVRVRADGRPVLLDLGVARDGEGSGTRTGVSVGTRVWMAPEQAEGRRVDASVDRYALGLIAYALLAGRMPWPDGTSEVIADYLKVKGELVPLPGTDVPAHVRDAITAMLAPDPAARPTSAKGWVQRMRAPAVVRPSASEEFLERMAKAATPAERVPLLNEAVARLAELGGAVRVVADDAGMAAALTELPEHGVVVLSPGVTLTREVRLDRGLAMVGGAAGPARLMARAHLQASASLARLQLAGGVTVHGGEPLVAECVCEGVPGAAFEVLDGTPLLAKCTATSGEIGVRVTGGAPTVHGCVLKCASGEGVVIEGAAGTYTDNRIEGCGRAGLRVAKGASPQVRNNRIHGGASAGVFVHDGGEGTFEGNDIFANKLAGVAVISGGAPVVRNNTIHDGLNAGVYVYNNSAGTFEGNDVYANKLAGVIVKTGGAPVVRNNRIHDGLDAGVSVSENGAGTFEANDIFANKLAGVAVTSGGAPVVRNNAIHDGHDAGACVYENGAGTFEGNDIYANTGGIIVETGGAPIARNNKIHDERAFGIVIGDNGAGTFEANDIFANKLPNIIVMTGGAPIVRNNKIHDGHDAGVHVCDNGAGLFEANDIYANTLPGIVVRTGSNPVVRNNRIRDGVGGILVTHEGMGVFETNDVSGFDTSVMVGSGGNPTLHGNTIGGGSTAAIVVTEGGAGTFERNAISSPRSQGWRYPVGMKVMRGGNPTVRENRISDFEWVAISVEAGGFGTFDQNEVCGSKSGITINQGRATLTNNKIQLNDTGIGLIEADATLEANEIINNGNGVTTVRGGTSKLNKNLIFNNKTGIWIHTNGRGTYESNTLHSNGQGNWKVDCPRCKNTGAIGLFGTTDCPDCVGGGQILRRNNTPNR